jgi:hypothetical protein
MFENKNLTKQELKYNYKDHLGFVFIGITPSSDESIQNLAQSLVDFGVSKKLPEFYYRPEPNVVVFVYDFTSGFKSGPFYVCATQFHVLNVFRIQTLGDYIDNL